MIQYQQWQRTDFKGVIRREVMDTNTRWFSENELNQYLDNWLQDLSEEFEFVYAINTLTIGSITTGSLIINTSTFNPGMLRHEAVYYNGFRLAGRLLQDLEVGDPTWRSDLGIGTSAGTNTFDTPRLAVMYPDSQNILIWPVPPGPHGTFSNIFVFEYPALLSFATDTSTCGLPAWCQWSAKPYVCSRLYMRPGPVNDPKRAQRYAAQYARAKMRVRRIWDSFMPERYRRLIPGQHYEWEILIPPPAWDAGTNTATGTGGGGTSTSTGFSWSQITSSLWSTLTPGQWGTMTQ